MRAATWSARSTRFPNSLCDSPRRILIFLGVELGQAGTQPLLEGADAA